jgi:tetratricopeptide (TPR) repeat protein
MDNGAEDAAQSLLEQAVRLELGGDSRGFEARQLLAILAIRRGDHAAAARWVEQIMLLRMRLGLMEAEAAGLTQWHLLRRCRAVALLKQGKAPEALAQIEICRKLEPSEIAVVIDAAPLLRKAGLAKEADDLQRSAIAAVEAQTAKYPLSASMHNMYSWLLVRLRTDLDKSMEHARKAHELAPDNVAITDTLAEVCFQKGDRKQAIELIDQCIRREPDNLRHVRVRERFDKGDPASEPPAEE